MRRDEYSFELLKSSSNIELSSGVSSGTPSLPRNFSHYDSIRDAPPTQSAIAVKLPTAHSVLGHPLSIRPPIQF
uniref:Uncharacterized protein n=1 Tax=Caenorhabditis japonica TaxID=281687 RepID=A0A8R1EM44_CAEJA